MNPYRTAGAPMHSGVIYTGPIESCRFEVPVGVSAVLTACALMLVCLVLGSGCTAAQIHAAEVIAADTAKCLVANQDKADQEAFLICGVQAAEEIFAKEILAGARKETAKHVEAAKKLGCGK